MNGGTPPYAVKWYFTNSRLDYYEYLGDGTTLTTSFSVGGTLLAVVIDEASHIKKAGMSISIDRIHDKPHEPGPPHD